MRLFACACALLAVSLTATAADPPVSSAEFDGLYPELQRLYLDLHQEKASATVEGPAVDIKKCCDERPTGAERT